MAWRRSEVDEALLLFYLRLNGYFTTSLVVHDAKWGANRAEIDCLAVRHPMHEQPDREVGCAGFLSPSPELIDLLICEVKSDPHNLHFNRTLQDDAETVRRVLQWAGVFRGTQLDAVTSQVSALLRANATLDATRSGVIVDGVRVRPLLCCPSAVPSTSNPWLLTGEEIFSFATQCLRPAERRDGCSTRYNFRLWGHGLAPLVEYFKNMPESQRPTLMGLYAALGTAK